MNNRTSPQTASAMEIGGRDEQQDSVGIETIGKNSILIVADGMGGHEGGKTASKIIVDEAIRQFQAASGQIENPQAFFNQIIHRSFHQIQEYAKQNRSPHSTVVMLLVQDQAAHWAHIGDCRLMQFHRKKFIKRTRDHSVVEVLFRQGEITEAEMASHPDQNKLLKSVGGNSVTEPSFGESAIQIEDAFLLCSDGLWESVRADEMAEILYTVPLQQAVDYLVGLANERTKKTGDNISCAVYAPQQLVKEKPKKVQKRVISSEVTVTSAFDSGKKTKHGSATLIWALIFVLACILLITGYLVKKEIGIFRMAKYKIGQFFSGDTTKQQPLKEDIEKVKIDTGSVVEPASDAKNSSVNKTGKENQGSENQ